MATRDLFGKVPLMQLLSAANTPDGEILVERVRMPTSNAAMATANASASRGLRLRQLPRVFMVSLRRAPLTHTISERVTFPQSD